MGDGYLGRGEKEEEEGMMKRKGWGLDRFVCIGWRRMWELRDVIDFLFVVLSEGRKSVD